MTEWAFPAVLQFGIWLIVGMLIGVLFLRTRSGRLIFSLAVTVVIVALVGLFSWTLELGNANVGWGLFALPSLPAGILIARALASQARNQIVYLSVCVIGLAFVLLPQYLMLMDEHELNRSYAEAHVISADPTFYFYQEVIQTLVYISVALSLLLLPHLIRYLESRQINAHCYRPD